MFRTECLVIVFLQIVALKSVQVLLKEQKLIYHIILCIVEKVMGDVIN